MVDTFLGLNPFAWVALIAAALTLLLLADALAGHYRSGFAFRSQYAPFLSGALLIAFTVTAIVMPNVEWANTALRGSAWIAIVTGGVGFGFHHYYGIAKKPGGYRWLLHYLMYGAPQLAPLALAMMGALSLISARGLAGGTSIAGLSLRAAMFAIVAVALAGAIVQAGILHYRGAFNNAAMYAPMTVPLLTVAGSLWAFVAPGPAALMTLAILLWLTLLTGFVGVGMHLRGFDRQSVGMHLRGFDRQMGGLYLPLFNLLEGPPASAPALFGGFAAVGLVAVYML
ncbi:MAG: hypothetical protein LC802_19015 [Acidobacteria bacterium]|nr:hypothetical protein [Acidobacteriota bacterium]